MAGTTGLEPAASAVTGQRSNQLNYVPKAYFYRVSGEAACLLHFLAVQCFALFNHFHLIYAEFSLKTDSKRNRGQSI